MKRMLFNATYQEELRVATVDGQRLVDFDIETSSKAQRRGNIYKGVITRVEASLEACFVDYGTEKQGFLPFKEIDLESLPAHIRDNGGISKLTVGIEFIVQVEKDERGNKGAALTTRISLPGRYLVLMPSNPKSSGISRRIDGEERDELKSVLSALEIPEDMSIIARTAALGRVQEELQWDLNYLSKLWDAIKTAANSNSGSFLIYQESNLVVRSIRDHFSPDITEVLIDTEEIYEQARLFISHVIPSFVNRVKFYNDDVPLFSRFQIEHQIESAYGRMVNLPSGGSIAVDITEALTAIDVNSARANKGSDIEATAFATNLEAAEEIARQMRLRDLGGLVVVDFIDMENSRNQREVENFFKQQLSFDRARIQMGKLSKFGLLELSRQRLQTSLEEATTIQCPRCSGVGTIRGIESNSLHILRIIQEEAVKNTKLISALHIQLPVPVATYLLNEKRDDVSKIESRMKVRIVIIPNIHLDSPNYKIKKISIDGSNSEFSFNLVDESEELEFEPQVNKADGANKALVKNFAPSEKAPVLSSSLFGNIVAKLSDMFKKPFEKKDVTPKKPEIQNTISTNRNTNNRPASTARTTTNPNRPQQARSGNTTTRRPPQNGPRPNTRGPNNRNPRVASSQNTQQSSNVASEKTNIATPFVSTPDETPKKHVAVNTTSTTTNNNVTSATAPSQHAVNNTSSNTTTTQTNPNRVAAPLQPVVNDTPVSNNKHTSKNETDLFTATTNNTVASEEKAKTPVAAKKPVRKARPYVAEKVDLGELQMVGTDAVLAKSVPTETAEPVVTGKRYSDVASTKSKTTVSTAIEYEIVETTK